MYEEVYASLALDSNLVQIGGTGGLVPSPAGTFASGTNLVTIKTNNPQGYSLTISTNQASSNNHAKDMKHLSLNHYVTSTNNTCTWNAGTNTLTNTTNTLANNTWGFTIYSANLTAQQLCQVPSSDSPLKIKSTTTANESGDLTNIFFGAKLDTNQPAGKYQATIVYTVVGNT
jgi:hypothetical protein